MTKTESSAAHPSAGSGQDLKVRPFKTPAETYFFSSLFSRAFACAWRAGLQPL